MKEAAVEILGREMRSSKAYLLYNDIKRQLEKKKRNTHKTIARWELQEEYYKLYSDIKKKVIDRKNGTWEKKYEYIQPIYRGL